MTSNLTPLQQLTALCLADTTALLTAALDCDACGVAAGTPCLPDCIGLAAHEDAVADGSAA